MAAIEKDKAIDPECVIPDYEGMYEKAWKLSNAAWIEQQNIQIQDLVFTPSKAYTEAALAVMLIQ